MSSRMTIIRQQYLRRMDAGEVILCALCGEPIPRRATGLNKIIKGGKGGLSIDHIIPRSEGGSTRVSNLQPTHTRCNFDKSHPIQTHLSEKVIMAMEAKP